MSGYNWEDGTGDKSLRPKRMELAWQSIETNEVGIDEFQRWAEEVGAELMMAVNLGTRGADDARNLVEYCNADTPTYYAEKRRQNGFEKDKKVAKWQIAPPLLEDIYNLEDALVVGCLLIRLMKNCGRVKIACLAQLVNVIAPIMTENSGRVWKQTIFYPYLHAIQYGRGSLLDVDLQCDTYSTKTRESVPCIEACAVRNGQEITVFAVNCSLTEPCDFKIQLNDTEFMEHIVPTSDDIKAGNSAEAEKVYPQKAVIHDTPFLPPKSWNVIRMSSLK